MFLIILSQKQLQSHKSSYNDCLPLKDKYEEKTIENEEDTRSALTTNIVMHHIHSCIDTYKSVHCGNEA